jgi:hypothetical protein
MSLVARFSIPHVVTCCRDCPHHDHDNYGDYYCYHKDAPVYASGLVDQNCFGLTESCPLVADNTAKDEP